MIHSARNGTILEYTTNMAHRYYVIHGDQPLHIGQSYRFDYKDKHGDPQTYFGKVEALGGPAVWIVCPSGAKHTLDLSTTEGSVDLLQDGILEVRFLWSRWTLTVNIERGKVTGSITGQSAKTVPYVTMFEDAVFCVDPLWMLTKTNRPEAPDTAERILCQMMHKWRRRANAIEAADVDASERDGYQGKGVGSNV